MWPRSSPRPASRPWFTATPPVRRSHTFSSAQRPATVLLIAVPGGLDEYFRHLHHAASNDEIAQIQERFGITVL
jgi:hypothetical protein